MQDHMLKDNSKPDFASLLQPALHHRSPASVLNDPDLEPHEKRAILSSWASDLHAVESNPSLRQVPGVTGTLRLSEICDALRALDEKDEKAPREPHGMYRPRRPTHPTGFRCEQPRRAARPSALRRVLEAVRSVRQESPDLLPKPPMAHLRFGQRDEHRC